MINAENLAKLSEEIEKMLRDAPNGGYYYSGVREWAHRRSQEEHWGFLSEYDFNLLILANENIVRIPNPRFIDLDLDESNPDYKNVKDSMSDADILRLK